jgi:Periplasmic binding protein
LSELAEAIRWPSDDIASPFTPSETEFISPFNSLLSIFDSTVQPRYFSRTDATSAESFFALNEVAGDAPLPDNDEIPASFARRSRGIISVNWGKDPGDPTWENDPGMKKWRAFMDKYYPEGDKNSSFNTYGYGTAQTLEKMLRACGDNLTRENVMKQFTNMKDVELDLLLPGIVMNTSPTDYRMIK